MADRRPVRVLREDVARRIAAGEVIDRPAAIVRELMDNAVDSGANSISVEIEGGGIGLVKVSDNGSGMTRDDLENCARAHATSKITDAEDLSKITTLGFRGEALASIAAVGTLEIASGNLKMSMSNSSQRKIETTSLFQGGKGTSVASRDLFSDFPARRVFLKRPSSETMMCREIFVEKSLARPDISFRLTVDGSMRMNLPAGVTLTQRFASALETRENATLLHEISSSGREPDGKHEWSFRLVIGDPSIRRNDRRSIFIYVNGRRVQEFALLQAIEYGCQGFFPNGTHPVAALFATVDPSLVDFNIHPAKKEVKFRDITSLHHGLSSSIKEFLRLLTASSMKNDGGEEDGTEGILPAGFDKEEEAGNEEGGTAEPKQEFLADRNFGFGKDSVHRIASNKASSKNEQEKNQKDVGTAKSVEEEYAAGTGKVADIELAAEGFGTRKKFDMRSKFMSFDTSMEKRAARNEPEKLFTDAELDNAENGKGGRIKFIGRTMETFILVEKRGVLYFVDQHAAHERLIFDKMMSGKEGNCGMDYAQQLLIPYTIETDDENEEKYLESLLGKLSEIGFSGKNMGGGVFEFSTVPSRWNGTQRDLKEALLEDKEGPERIMYKIYATAACRRAVMQGMPLDDKTAEEIAESALSLPDPHCPHGRPIWFTMTKEQMFARVRRTES